jgi:hypothetical protein
VSSQALSSNPYLFPPCKEFNTSNNLTYSKEPPRTLEVLIVRNLSLAANTIVWDGMASANLQEFVPEILQVDFSPLIIPHGD